MLQLDFHNVSVVGSQIHIVSSKACLHGMPLQALRIRGNTLVRYEMHVYITVASIHRIVGFIGSSATPMAAPAADQPTSISAPLGVFVKFKRSMIQKRVKTDIKRVRAKGQRWGRRTIEETDPASCTKILDLRRQGLGMAAIGKLVGMSSRTIWRFLRGLDLPTSIA